MKKASTYKLVQRRKLNLIINYQQIDQIKQYIKQISSIPAKISMIKQVVQLQFSGAKAPLIQQYQSIEKEIRYVR